MADTLLRGGICLKESSILSQVITRYFALSRFYVFAFDASKCDAELVWVTSLEIDLTVDKSGCLDILKLGEQLA